MKTRILGVAVVFMFSIHAVQSQDLSNMQLIAHYPLSDHANDITGNQEPMSLDNTPFQDGGIYCNGNYPGDDPDPCDAFTPPLAKFNFSSFAVSATFKVIDPIEERRPILVFGKYYRWGSIFITPDSMLGCSQTAKFLNVSPSDTRYVPDTWHTVTFVYDSTKGWGRFYVDGVIADSSSTPIKHHDDNMFTITHEGYGRVFKGILKDVKFYSTIETTETEIEQDSLALIALYNSTHGDDWTDKTNWLNGPVSDWYGITVTDGRVTRIALSSNHLTGEIPPEFGNLEYLKYLYLNDNQLTGAFPTELVNLTNLHHLYIHSNQFSGVIPTELENLSRLTNLNLSDNHFSGAIPAELGNLDSLIYLNLCENQLSGSIPPELGNLTNLQHLYLHNNQLTGNIPETIWDLVNLTFLFLNDNQFTGSISAELGNLVHLTRLILHKNQFTGTIPPTITNLSFLESFMINDNFFVDLPDLSSMTHLAWLSIENNKFTFEDIEPNIGMSNFTYSPQDSVGQSRQISVESGAPFTLSVTVGGKHNQYAWKKDGTVIAGADSSYYIINAATDADAGTYTCDITNSVAIDLTLHSRPCTVQVKKVNYAEQDSLALVALYDSTDGSNWTDNTNWLSGPVSTWHGITAVGGRVKQIDLSSNNLTGEIPSEFGNLNHLTSLTLYQNQLTGPIPHELGNLSNLEYLYLNDNQFSGAIPSELGNLTRLIFLYLSNNQFSGAIPNELGNLNQLTTMNLSKNQLTGTIPAKLCSLVNLTALFLNNNQLTDTIPAEISNLTNLTSLSLCRNQFTGVIPSDITDLSKLKELVINNNNFVDLPDLSSMTPLALLFIENNKFTFEDIEPNIGISNFTYSPQDSVGQAQDTTVTEGQHLSLTVDVGGSANQYLWYKNGTAMSGSDSSVLSFETISLSDSGVYTCHITNSLVPELTIYCRPIWVHVDPVTGITRGDKALPDDYALLQNYPNPFNPQTSITYHLPQVSDVRLTIYNSKGQSVRHWVHMMQPAGCHHIIWNGCDDKGQAVASGMYFYRIKTSNKEKHFVDVKKMLFLQ